MARTARATAASAIRQEEFVGEFAHELRTPLSVIKGALGLLRESLPAAGAEQGELVEMCQAHCQRMARLVENMLALSRLASPRGAFRIAAVDIADSARDRARAFRLIERERAVEIVERYQPGLARLSADPDLVAELIDNLLSNALRFARTRVTLSAASDRGGVRVTVSDDGPGIPPGALEGAFDAFSRAGRAAQPDGYRGTGLGLAICRRIVARHRGSIRVDSSTDAGTRISFALPSGARKRARS